MWDDTASRSYYDSELHLRANRPVGQQRADRLDWFIDACKQRQHSHVVEVGAGAGRDGLRIQASGLTYTGADLSEVGATICRDRGLNAIAAPATQLPFHDDSFDAGWTMSTLMHLPEAEYAIALGELRRVLCPGSLLAVGLWGSTESGARVDENGRLFRQQTDDQLRTSLSTIGELLDFQTWDWFDDGGHYQWAVITTN